MTSELELETLQQLARDRIVLELGSQFGTSTLAMAVSAKRVHSVDHHRGDPHAGEIDTLNRFLLAVRPITNVVIHIGDFSDVCGALKRQHFDMVFVDGYHTYEQVAWDIEMARPLLKKKGCWAFHDYTLPEFGVKQAVDEAFMVDSVIDTLAIVR